MAEVWWAWWKENQLPDFNTLQPEVLWADGAGDAPCTHDSVKYWKSPEFLSWVYNESPVKDTVVANSRWGSGAIGDYQTGGDR